MVARANNAGFFHRTIRRPERYMLEAVKQFIQKYITGFNLQDLNPKI